MTKLKDIADVCGVSISTVSRALNGSSLIGQETAQEIRNTARRMGYRPNEIARTLKTNRSGMIGILYDTGMNHPFFSGVLEALRTGAEKRGYDIMLLSRNRQENAVDTSDLALTRRVDGVIVAYADPANDELDRLMENRIPVVSVDDCHRPCPMIVSDYEEGTVLLVEEAIRRGRRRIAFFHGEHGFATDLRIQGFQRAMAAHGLTGELIPARFNHGRLCAEMILERRGRPDAPDCCLLPDDYSALDAVNRLNAAGLRVPECIGIAGFDGQDWIRTLCPRLCTFRQNLEGIGEAAIETLLAVRSQGIPFERSQQIIPGTLLDGETL